jgi:imidazolonepropionase-like amidohydrolase
MKNIFIYFLFFSLCFSLNAQKNKIALINAHAHIGNGEVIENSLIVINGKNIEVVTDITRIRLDYKSFDTVLDLTGKHVYPGIINTNNTLGLHDAEAIRATVDFQEVGALNAHIRSLIAYNTDNIIVPTIKTNGILYTQATPRGNLISGSSSIMALEGWNWEDAVLKADDGIHLNFPTTPIRRNRDDDKIFKNSEKRYHDELKILESFFQDAIAYDKENQKIEKNLRLEAMRLVIQGNANLYIHADRAQDILAVINFIRKHNIAKPVLVGGKESYKLTAELKKNSIPVILNRVNDLPDHADDNVDIIYSLPYLLQKDSVLFCLQMEGDMEAMNSRNLPFNAGAAVAYGLTKEQAISAITLNAAKILGVHSQIGSLQEGKLASLIVSDGDILDMRTNNIVLAYIAGKKVDLNNLQTELYIKYKNKYGIK